MVDAVRNTYLGSLLIHLVRRELASLHRFSALGLLWPLVKLLTQFAVLAFIFTAVVDLGIEEYPSFLFTGLLAWLWFVRGVSDGSGSVVERRHLIFQPGFPRFVLPLVTVGVSVVDAAVGLVVLLGLVALTGGLAWTALLVPLVAVIQLALICGLAWLAGALTVYLRDVKEIVALALTVLFYLTPVFYETARLPDSARSVLELNPLTALLDAYRSALVDGRVPDLASLGLVALAAAAIALAGLLVFRRLEGGFADEL